MGAAAPRSPAVPVAEALVSSLGSVAAPFFEDARSRPLPFWARRVSPCYLPPVQLFVSYAHADREFARKMADRLEAKGHSVWLPEKDLLPGENWARAMDSALSRAEVMVALVSPAAVESEFVSREWQYALGEERFAHRLIPIEIKETASRPWIFERLNLVQASTPTRAALAVENALANLAKPPRVRASR
jgi:TIR domain